MLDRDLGEEDTRAVSIAPGGQSNVRKERSMKRLLLLGLAALSLASAAQAAAGTTTVSVSASFTEPIVQNLRSGCPVFPDGFCGMGAVVPFGHATESILFGGACSGSCDFRTVNLAGGSIYLHEFFSNPACPGSCHPNPAAPFSGTLTDVVVGGTGVFAGATGNVSGSVFAAGLQSAIKLSGAITLAT